MKKTLLVLAMTFVGITQSLTAQQPTAKLTIRTSAVCPSCKTTIENGMNLAKGVKNATLNLDSNWVEIDYKPSKTNPEKLRLALTQIGYDADNLPAQPHAYDALMTCCKKEYGKHDN